MKAWKQTQKIISTFKTIFGGNRQIKKNQAPSVFHEQAIIINLGETDMGKGQKQQHNNKMARPHKPLRKSRPR